MTYPIFRFSMQEPIDWLYSILNDWYPPKPVVSIYATASLEFEMSTIQTLVMDEFLAYIYSGNMPMFISPLEDELEPFKPGPERIQYLRTTLKTFFDQRMSMMSGFRTDVFYNPTWISPVDLELELIPEQSVLPYQIQTQ